MLPVNQAIENNIVENKQNISKNDINKERINDRLSFLLRYIKITNPKLYNEMNKKITNFLNEESDECDILHGYFFIGIVFCWTGIGLIIAIYCYNTAIEMGCEWAVKPGIPDW